MDREQLDATDAPHEQQPLDSANVEAGAMSPEALNALEEAREKMFDPLALGVMERNAEAIEAQEERDAQRLKDAPSVTFRVDVCTADQREQNASVGRLDLRKLCMDAMQQQSGVTELPSNTCYIENIHIEDAINTLPVDVRLSCKQDTKIRGNFSRSRIAGEEASHDPSTCLFVAHSGTQMHSDLGREVYRGGDFTTKSKFRIYSQALQKDIEDSVTEINGGKAVEYLSPWAVLTADNVAQGDWFVNVMYKNPTSFKHAVQAIRTPVDDNKYICSFRLHMDDWKDLNAAVQSSVLQPLRQNVFDLSTDSELHFTLKPDVAAACDPNDQLVKRSGTHLWHADGLRGHKGRAAVTMRATVRFI